MVRFAGLSSGSFEALNQLCFSRASLASVRLAARLQCGDEKHCEP
jgi:hypothetical protein